MILLAAGNGDDVQMMPLTRGKYVIFSLLSVTMHIMHTPSPTVSVLNVDGKRGAISCKSQTHETMLDYEHLAGFY